MNFNTQNDNILAYSKKKYISGLVALELFGCLHLPRRILDLKEKGYQFHDRWVKKNNKRFKEYRCIGRTV